MVQLRFGFEIVVVTFLIWSCGSPASDPSAMVDVNANQALVDTTFHKIIVNNLRLRTAPDLASNTVTLLKEGVIVKCWGERSQKKSAINLRGENISDYWYKIEYGAHSGWVFGGALQTIDQVPEGDFLILPGKRVGPILENDNEASLLNRLGKEAVQRKNVSIGDGERLETTVVFPGEDSQVTIFWQEQNFENIYEIRIEKPNAPWKTVEGISIGKTLKDIQEINQIPFLMSGFDWDYAGTTVDWKQGAISDQIVLVFNTPENPHPSLLGDHSIPSDNRYLRRSNPEVKTIRVLFPK